MSVKISGNTLAFAAPPLQRSGTVAADLLADIATALRITPDDIVASNWIDNGPGWTGVLLRSAAEKASGIDYEVRALIPDAGLGEDPVTGSANAGLAQWLIAAGHAPREYVARQGTVIPTITGTVRI